MRRGLGRLRCKLFGHWWLLSRRTPTGDVMRCPRCGLSEAWGEFNIGPNGKPLVQINGRWFLQ